jgi:hypothetical protein
LDAGRVEQLIQSGYLAEAICQDLALIDARNSPQVAAIGFGRIWYARHFPY